MINLEDEVIYDHRLSCTEEEAVAKLLGWMQGSKRLRHLAVTEDGLNADQFPHMYQLPSSISEFIGDEREQASIRFQNACVAKNFELAAKWESVVEYWDAINERAVRYKQGIAAELSRPKPRLITDKAISDETGVHHITLLSLDHWARITYGEGILDQEHKTQIVNLPPPPKRARVKGLEEECAIIEAIKQLGIDPEKVPRNPPGKPGVKAAVRKILSERDDLFSYNGSFDKTWEDLRREKRIADSECPQNKFKGETCE